MSTSSDDLLDILIDRLAEAVVQRLVNQMPIPGKATEDGLLDGPEMARRLGISQPTLDRMRATGTVPHIRIGRRVVYMPDQVIAALQVADHE